MRQARGGSSLLDHVSDAAISRRPWGGLTRDDPDGVRSSFRSKASRRWFAPLGGNVAFEAPAPERPVLLVARLIGTVSPTMAVGACPL
jgi:hypothetical protein